MTIQLILNQLSSKRLLFYVFLVLSLVLCGLIVANSFLTTKELSRVRWTTSVDMIDQRMNSILDEINNFPRTAGNDVVFLSGLSSVKQADATNIEKHFLTFLRENTAYYKLAYIDSQGKVRVLTEFDGKNFTTSRNPSPESFDIKWIGNADMLGSGEVFISHIELVRKGTALTPIITYATPIYSENSDRKGIVASVVYADYFLDDIRSSQREGETVFLIDNQGNYLAHPDRKNEFGNLLGHGRRFQNDYTEVTKEVLTNPEKRTVTSKTHVFSVRPIYPTKGSFALYKGSQNAAMQENQYFWILVSVADKKHLENGTKDLVNGAGIFMLLSIASLFGIAAIGYLLAFQ